MGWADTVNNAIDTGLNWFQNNEGQAMQIASDNMGEVDKVLQHVAPLLPMVSGLIQALLGPLMQGGAQPQGGGGIQPGAASQPATMNGLPGLNGMGLGSAASLGGMPGLQGFL